MCALLLQARTQYPGPVSAARAGECLLILFPRTGTGTVFLLENRHQSFMPGGISDYFAVSATFCPGPASWP